MSQLMAFIRRSKRLLVLTGAGISTESGIPDYRSEGVGLYARSGHRPITIRQFLEHEEARRRYWVRNYVFWPRFSSLQPNSTHSYLRRLGDHGKAGLVVTQNVDSLHQKAGGSHRTLELHGTAYVVRCMSCGKQESRHGLQKRIEALNPCVSLPQVANVVYRPDGDADIRVDVDTFSPPSCTRCGGILKPDIVFFGENVPRQRSQQIWDELEKDDGMLVIGSSLQVYSGYQYVVEASERHIPVVIVNIGPTRADHLASLKISSRCGLVFEHLLSKDIF